MQKYTSQNTSINTISKIYKNAPFQMHSTILDYGCGKYETAKTYMEEQGHTVYLYDKYNRTTEENEKNLQNCKQQKLNYIVCSNVLNVIMEDDILCEILEDLTTYMDNETILYLSVYEGDKTGIGKPTSKGYQRNQPYKSYLPLLSNYFDISVKKQIFVCTKKRDIV